MNQNPTVAPDEAFDVLQPDKINPLPRRFYEGSAALVAPKLLGHLLVRRVGKELIGGVIVEVEAYLRDDPASHAFRGLTPRNKTMFGPPGHAYVYFIYGNHHCVNAVTNDHGIGEAVLIRAVEPQFGIPQMTKNRGGPGIHDLASGPGRLCAAMAIDRDLDTADLCDAESPLFITRNPALKKMHRESGPMEISARIGINIKMKEAAAMPLRFFFSRNAHVSRSSKKLRGKARTR